MKISTSLVAIFILLPMISPTPASINYVKGNIEEVVRCESNDGGRKNCPANTRNGVYLKYQYSKSGCWEGETWG